MDQTIYMHGGFENETPNIPTNSIMKLDLIAHVKGNTQLMHKLENAFQSHMKSSGNPNAPKTNQDSSPQSLNSNSSRATTPPMQSLAKAQMKIRMGKVEIEQKKG